MADMLRFIVFTIACMMIILICVVTVIFICFYWKHRNDK